MASTQEKPANVGHDAVRTPSDNTENGSFKENYVVDDKKAANELSDDVQLGVRKMEATTEVWSKWNLAAAYIM
jgi:hypothetical protein